MPASPSSLLKNAKRIGDSRLAARLGREVEGEVLFDPFSRGRYSTDASIYRIEPIGVVVPRTKADVIAAIGIAREEDIPILPRGAGTSQNGQTVGQALVVDASRYLEAIVDFDAEARRITVEPGIVLDHLNAFLKPHGLMFPVDPSTASRATIGGMSGNNSSGARSIRYGLMADNVSEIEAILADGYTRRFGAVPGDLEGAGFGARYLELVQAMRTIAAREGEEIAARVPNLLRRVGGYNIDSVSASGHNMARMLVGSEGTLAFFTEIELKLAPVPPHRVVGVCHFASFREAMESTPHIVGLGPDAVELIDRTMIGLAREIAAFRPTVERFVNGEPDALLLVEFAGDEHAELMRRLGDLEELMGSLGFARAVVRAVEPGFQAAIAEVRRAGLDIFMSMKGDAKPISFIEDCAVPLDDLAEYTGRLDRIFEKHGAKGTWYAHASVGCLHVRPVLNMKDGGDVRKMREIAEEALAMVRAYKGSHSGEHGDGLSRSEFHEAMFGPRLVAAFEEVKEAFDSAALLNPGKIVRAPAFDSRELFRFPPGYRYEAIETALDWSTWGGFGDALEMCNNNGACRKSSAGVMCPSYRVTRDEQHVTRGRANTLRLALSGGLGPDALTSDAMHETLALCVGCKGCKRECPTGVDMARIKIEALFHYRRRHGIGIRERAVAYLPRYAPRLSGVAGLLNLRDRAPGLAGLSERLMGLSARRTLPVWRYDPFRADERPEMELAGDGRDVVVFADTFNAAFEPDNLRAAIRVLEAAGYRVHLARPPGGWRGPCCGRTFLSVGLVEEARAEARRTLDCLRPFIERGVPVVGLEPSCILTLRDEFLAMLPGAETEALAERAYLFEEFLAAEHAAGRLHLALEPARAKRALVHGHCHQKAFGAMDAIGAALGLVPGLEVETIAAGCCGMAGAFGYEAEHFELSMRMAELDLLPAVRAAGPDALIVADGTSCRHQIRDGTGREAVHAARLLDAALPTGDAR